ncbi:MAG: hypothetical protein FWF43_04595 [Propionibacteriaceae bacterium]|nr:hypothetical protein [Propionibacteriaceae bacterium]
MMFESLIVGVAASLVASVVWVGALRLLRPRVDIAKVACYSPGKHQVTIKVVNRSRRAIVGIRVEVAVITQFRAAGGLVGHRLVVPLLSPEPLAIEGYKRDNDDRNAYRFSTLILRDDIFTGESSALRFGIYCQDELSGVGRLVQQSYFDASEVVTGSYSKGQDFRIVQHNDEGVEADSGEPKQS